MHTASTCSEMQKLVTDANRPRMNTGLVYVTDQAIGGLVCPAQLLEEPAGHRGRNQQGPCAAGLLMVRKLMVLRNPAAMPLMQMWMPVSPARRPGRCASGVSARPAGGAAGRCTENGGVWRASAVLAARRCFRR